MTKLISENSRADLFRVVPRPFSFRSFANGLRNQGFRYLYFTRLRSATRSRVLKFLLRFVVRHYTYKFGFQIPVTQIGGGLYLGHFGTIVISENSTIGRNCNIAHVVTIGAERGKNARAPRIGDSVWIGTGAVVVGDIRIGSNVLIAPNAFVNFDVPDESVVIGNPGIISIKKNPTEGYVNNKYHG